MSMNFDVLASYNQAAGVALAAQTIATAGHDELIVTISTNAAGTGIIPTISATWDGTNYLPIYSLAGPTIIINPTFICFGKYPSFSNLTTLPTSQILAIPIVPLAIKIVVNATAGTTSSVNVIGDHD